MLRITLAQLNPTVGDFAGNLALMRAAAETAQRDGAQLVVFPELSLTGYYPGDLLDEPAFLAASDAALAELLAASHTTPGLNWVIGAPTRRQGPGKPLSNSLLVIADGEVRLQYAKQLLPTYNIFDERRHFEPGPDNNRVLRIGAWRVGFLICEDGWNDDGRDYAVNPFQRLAEAAPDLVVSINASPSNIGKREQRHRLFATASHRHDLPLLYVNQVGGQDQLVFDGASFAVTPQDGVVFEARRFEEDVRTLAFDGARFVAADGAALPAVDPAGLPAMAFYRRQTVLGLRDYARRCGFTHAVIGCSGGIDSALTLALAAEALGADNVTAITMPSRFSSAGSVDDSVTLCRNLGVRLIEHPIRDMVDAYATGFAAAFGAPLAGLPLENLQARVRGTVLMEYSNAYGHLLLTTGNKSEISVGYCTLYGDTNGGLGLIGDLYKTEVYALSRHLNEAAGRELIPAPILDKEPSAELAPGQRDTDSLPPYPVLDALLKVLVEGPLLGQDERAAVEAEYARLTADAGGQALVARIRSLIARNEYKRRQAPPILRLRARAFGSGRQMPIAARHVF
ncbi:NAD+ synthase [Chitiniphilus purpureus]|uniref:Glutamine-dependent NAD(+) synthetase n=1 Tax=Chitiniphilus purpureus TaxID=2981137 RepID=A0ABY6DPY1_9NEIS|nr:NAD+ synthase [Chitiniphilus sp. CD1]UXY15758.1 NAD+ synthase [Chitiniphilus sp. CD1]